MVRLINNFTVSCREVINNELVNVNYVSENPENCYCDFRINLRYCKGEQFYLIATWILVIYSILIGCISMYFLYNQVFIVGQSLFFPPSRFRGILRPRPQETFHLICFSCNLLQVIHLLVKLFDGYQNTLHAELYLDIPRLVSYALATLYPISIKNDNEDNEIISITSSKRKPKPLESIHRHFNDDNFSISNRSNISIISNKSSHNELFSYHHLNKSDRQIYRYGYESSNNSSPKSSSSNLSSPSDRDEFYINGNSPLKNNFDVNIQKEVNFSNNNSNNNSIIIDDDDDDSIFNIDKKEWLAKKPRRIPLKKSTM
ncbi:4234_t:CDS:2 [Rhizophagus irregularis]|nr:4234_t:CDS:2 [Rhizophagus irregularis]